MFILNSYRAVVLNTFIGNVGSTSVTSPADFAAFSRQLGESDILGFVINGDNSVSFRVEKDYKLDRLDPFNNDDDLTYFIDEDGFCVKPPRCEGCDFITHAYFPGATYFGSQFSFNNNTRLTHVNFESLTDFDSRFQLCDAEFLKILKLNSLTQVSNTGNQSSLNELRRLEVLYIPLLTTFSTMELNRSYIRNPGRFPLFLLTCILASSPVCYHNSTLGVQDRKAFLRVRGIYAIGDSYTVNGRIYTAVSTPSNEGEFDGSALNFAEKITNDTRTPTVTMNFTYKIDGDFFVLLCDTIGATGNTITATADAGNTEDNPFVTPTFIGGNDVHVTLMELRDFSSVTLVQISTAITVNPPTSLTFSNLTTNSVDLDFTLPTANAKGTIGYEVWLDDGTQYAKYFEYDTIATTGDTLDLSSVVSGAGSVIGSKIKIRTIDGHYSFSAFTDQITLT